MSRAVTRTSFSNAKRCSTVAVRVGGVTIGGGAPVAVQSMLNVRSGDVAGNVAQAQALWRAGCEILRVAIPDMAALALIPAIKEATPIPLVADIHFDYRLAVESVAAGADKIRINPGNIGGADRVKTVVAACRGKEIPIRVGVNSGSLEKKLLAKYGGPTAEALAQSALENAALIERFDYDNLVLSMKSSDLQVTVAACRLAAARCDYPLHLGVTEAGTAHMGLIKSAVGIGALLCDGIGDTIRVSLAGDPVREVAAGFDILRAVGLRRRGAEIIACPTCGRTEIDVAAIAEEIERATVHIDAPIKIAVMGCAVNGPGEAAGADIGIAGGKGGEALLFKKGKVVRKLTGDIAGKLLKEIEKM